ncbi:MAG: MurR/RpiR family transcriptional regulator [Burkholderiaceae bacterium]
MSKKHSSAVRKSPLSATPAPTGNSETAFAQSSLGRKLIVLQNEGSKSNRAIADYLLRNPVRIPAWSIEEVAGRAAVSTATLSRFARTLGFDGYAELRSEIAEALQSVLQPIEKLRSSLEHAGSRAGTPVTDGLENTLSNVRAAAQALSAELLSAAVTRLTQAEHVYTLGFGLSAHLAAILALDLQPFCPRMTNVVEFGGTEVAAGQLMNITRHDVLVVVSFPRYANDAINLTHYARQRGAAVVAITDSPASPLAQLADCLLLAPATHPVLSSSLSAGLVVIETLVSRLMVSNKNNVEQAAKLTEAISAYMYRGEPARAVRAAPLPAPGERKKRR